MATEGYHGLNWQRRNYPVLSLEEASVKLREHEGSLSLPPVGKVLVLRFESLRLESNQPCHDMRTYETVDFGESRVWQFWGVFDGHAGWQCSTVLSQSLVSYVAEELKSVLAGGTTASDEAIDDAIKKGSLRLDEDILQAASKAIQDETLSRLDVLVDVAPAAAGSMAVLALYDAQNSVLRVASVGDSAAVLGQVPDRPDEREKLLAAHPDEPDMIAKGRVAGLPVTRAFGDMWTKLPLDLCKKAHELAYCMPTRPNNKTPSYLHAEPEIATTAVRPGDFAILGTDGVWDTMSAENAVECLARWIHETNRRVAAGAEPLGRLSDAHAPSDPVPGCDDLDSQIGHHWKWKARPQDLVVEDANVATHLIRNALAGNRREQFRTVMSVLQPYADGAKDDMTAHVIFFGDVVKAS